MSEFLFAKELLSFCVASGKKDKGQTERHAVLEREEWVDDGRGYTGKCLRKSYVLPDGTKHGKTWEYNDGRLISESEWSFGHLHGLETEYIGWIANYGGYMQQDRWVGKISRKTEWKNGYKDGKEIQYDYSEGKPHIICSFKDGFLHGENIIFGGFEIFETYDMGVLHGRCYRKDADTGEISEDEMWENGRRIEFQDK